MATTSARYEIRFEGALGEGWSAWFDGLQVASEGSETVISGVIADQSALHGVSVSSTSSIAIEMLSANSTSSATSGAVSSGSGNQGPT